MVDATPDDTEAAPATAEPTGQMTMNLWRRSGGSSLRGWWLPTNHAPAPLVPKYLFQKAPRNAFELEPVAYDIELHGLSGDPGTVDAVVLRDVLAAWIDAAGRSLRLAVEDQSTPRGKQPAWITDSVRFRVNAIRKGSTVLPVDVPRLGATAGEVLSQTDVRKDLPDPDTTVLTLLEKAISDIARGNRESRFYDSGVLKAVSSFGNVLQSSESIYLRGVSEEAVSYDITPRHVAEAKKLRKETPASRAMVVTGEIRAIRSRPLSFELETDDGSVIRGDAEGITDEEERLRALRNQKATVEGMADCTPSRRVRFIDARVVRAFQPKDAIFDKMYERTKQQMVRESSDPVAELRQYDAGESLERVRGCWPGDESIEEILDALD